MPLPSKSPTTMPRTHRPYRSTALPPLSLALVLALGLSACSKDEPAPAAAPATTAAAPAAPSAEAQAAAAAAARLAALTPEELRTKGRQALSEQRLYAPAGDNAMEYYLALRDKAEKPDVSAESALIDLQPYAVIAAEQAIGRADFAEAERLRGLIARADPQAPSLQRIADAIVKARENAEVQAAQELTRAEEEKRLEEQARLKAQQDAAAQALAARQAAVAPAPTPVAAAPAPQPVAPPPVAAPVQPAPQPAAAPARAALVAVNTPQPPYPPEALRAGVGGEVEVEISIGADGNVSEVRVLRATPRNTFERGVQNTVRRWKFQPIAAPTTIRRTFTFKQ